MTSAKKWGARMFESYFRRVGRTNGDLLRDMEDCVSDAIFNQSVYHREVIVKRVDTGIPVFNEDFDELLDAHFEQKSIYNVGSDEPTSWLTFRPHAHIEHPEIAVGSYVSVPDSDGNREIWLITSIEDDGEGKKYQILKTEWVLQWMVENRLYKCLVCLGSFSAYSRGTSNESVTTKLNATNSIVAPTNSDTSKIRYNERFVIDTTNREVPLCWEVSGINDVSPIGLTKFSISQVAYDQQYDNVALKIADYYATNLPIVEGEPTRQSATISFNGTKPTVKVGASKTLTVSYSGTHTMVWSVTDKDGTYTTSNDRYTLTVDGNSLKIKVAKLYALSGYVLTVKAQDQNDSTFFATKSLEVTV